MDQGTLGNAEITVFSGFFSSEDAYSYLQAKSQLKRAMGVLRNSPKLASELGMLPTGLGRGAITGKDGDAVWDFLRMRGASEDDQFTRNPHLTLGVRREAVEAMVTFPNGLRSPVRKNLKRLGHEGCALMLKEVLARMQFILKAQPKARPIVRVVQRRYPSQRSTPILDALVEFDLRTITSSEKGDPKFQPEWLYAAIDAFLAKKSNLQFQLGISYGYGDCPTASTPKATKLIEDGWLACRPMIDAVLDA